MVWDPERQRMLLFGGYTRRADQLESFDYHDDTWSWDGERWTELPIPAGARPSPRGVPELTWDPDLRMPMLFGGRFEFEPLADTWVLTASAGWARLPDAPLQPTLFTIQVSANARDEQSGEWVVYTLADTPDDTFTKWAWKNGTWRSSVSDERPRMRYSPAMAWDPVRQTIVFHGGRQGGVYEDYFGHDTWSWDGASWRRLYLNGPEVFAHRLVWVPPQRALLVVGGQSDGDGCTGEWCQDMWWLRETGWEKDSDAYP
jgi:hypothetical protein